MKIDMKEFNYRRYQVVLTLLKDLAEYYDENPDQIGREIVNLLQEFEI